MRILCVWAAAIIIAGCGVMQPPAQPTVPDSYTVAAPVTVTWSRVLDQLTAEGHLVMHSDRTGGVIRTEWHKIRDHGRTNTIMECGKVWGRQFRAEGEWGGWMRVQVIVREHAEQQSVLRIQPEYQIWHGVTGPNNPMGMSAHECVTTGMLERELVQAITTVS